MMRDVEQFESAAGRPQFDCLDRAGADIQPDHALLLLA
jgi:hypothetical protein